MSAERTVEFDDWIHAHVESVRESFDETRFGSLDYSTAVNMLILGGLVFPPEDPDDPRWEEVYAYLRESEIASEPVDDEYRKGTDRVDPDSI